MKHLIRHAVTVAAVTATVMATLSSCGGSGNADRATTSQTNATATRSSR